MRAGRKRKLKYIRLIFVSVTLEYSVIFSLNVFRYNLTDFISGYHIIVIIQNRIVHAIIAVHEIRIGYLL